MNFSKDIVNFIIQTELTEFKQNYPKTPVTLDQDLSSLAIEWLCFNCNNLIESKVKNEILSFVKKVYDEENYHTNGWQKIHGLSCAAYVLSEDEFYINKVFKDLDCKQSTTRSFLCKALSIIVAKLPFENDFFKDAVKENFFQNNGLASETLILLLASAGSTYDKKIWVEEFLMEVDNHKETISDILNGNYEHIFFTENLHSIKDFILFSIVNHEYMYDFQLKIFENEPHVTKTLNRISDTNPFVNQKKIND